MRETDLQTAILAACARGAVRLFRINAGSGWTGKLISRTKSRVILANPRPFRGAPEGYSDLTGWTSVVITPDMVGRRVAVYTAIEVKSERGPLREAQKRFHAILRRHGGITSVARSLEAAQQAIRDAQR